MFRFLSVSTFQGFHPFGIRSLGLSVSRRPLHTQRKRITIEQVSGKWNFENWIGGRRQPHYVLAVRHLLMLHNIRRCWVVAAHL